MSFAPTLQSLAKKGILPFGIFLLCACADSASQRSSDKSAGDKSPVVTSSTQIVGDEKMGLPDFCKLSKSDAGRSCITCTPRNFPTMKCLTMTRPFDPKEACRLLLKTEELRCDSADGQSLVLALNRIPVEEIILNLPSEEKKLSTLLTTQVSVEWKREVLANLMLMAPDFFKVCGAKCDGEKVKDAFMNELGKGYTFASDAKRAEVRAQASRYFDWLFDALSRGDYDAVDVQEVIDPQTNARIEYRARISDKYELMHYQANIIRSVLPADHWLWQGMSGPDPRVDRNVRSFQDALIRLLLD